MGRPNQLQLSQGTAEIRELWQWLATQKLSHFRLFTNGDFNLKGRYTVLAPCTSSVELAKREGNPDMVSFVPIALDSKPFQNNVERLSPQDKQNIVDNYIPFGGAWIAKKEEVEKEAYYSELRRQEFERKPAPTLQSLAAEVEALKAALLARAGK